MTKAKFDVVLLLLHNAVRYLQVHHSTSLYLSTADREAIAILKQAARNVLGVRSTQ